MKTIVECLTCNHKSITPERYYDFNIVPESRIRSAKEPAPSKRVSPTSSQSISSKEATNIFAKTARIDQMLASDINSTQSLL